MTSSRQQMANMSVDAQESQIAASYFISSNNRSFIRNRHFAVYEPMSHGLPVQMKAQQKTEPEEHFQDEQGNAISPLSRGQSSSFLDTEDESDNSEAIVGNSNYRSDIHMESSYLTTPQQTRYEPQHHFIVALSPSFESDNSDFQNENSNDNRSVGEANEVRRLPPPSIRSPNNNNCSPTISSTPSDYLAKLQAEISSLQRDVYGMQESILLLTRNLQKGRVERIRNNMISKYGHQTNCSFSTDTSSLSGLDDIDALINECLNSINDQSINDEESESRYSTSYSQVMKSLDRRIVQQKERKSAIRTRFQQRQRRRRREAQSPVASITPVATPRRVTPLESIQTPSTFPWDDGNEHVKRTLFLAGNIPCSKVTTRDGGDMTRDDGINRILLVLVFLATAAVLLTTDVSAQSNGKTREQTQILCNRRLGLAAKKLTIEIQLKSCYKSEESSMPRYNPKQPQFVQDLLVWRSYREGKARLDPWKAIMLSLRERSSDPSAENYNNLVSEYTFWL